MVEVTELPAIATPAVHARVLQAPRPVMQGRETPVPPLREVIEGVGVALIEVTLLPRLPTAFGAGPVPTRQAPGPRRALPPASRATALASGEP